MIPWKQNPNIKFENHSLTLFASDTIWFQFITLPASTFPLQFDFVANVFTATVIWSVAHMN